MSNSGLGILATAFAIFNEVVGYKDQKRAIASEAWLLQQEINNAYREIEALKMQIRVTTSAAQLSAAKTKLALLESEIAILQKAYDKMVGIKQARPWLGIGLGAGVIFVAWAVTRK